MQVTLSLYGAEIPAGFTAGAAAKRRTIWEIAAPYALSREDMLAVQATSPGLVDLWLTTFTNSLKGILIKLFRKTKEHVRHYFPDSEYIPKADAAALVGLPSGRNILERYALLHTHYSPKYCVFTALYVRWTNASGELKYTQLIPEGNEAPDEDEAAEGDESVRTKRRKPNRLTSKGALYLQYDWTVHRFLTHLRRVHPHLLPMLLDVANNGVKVLVKVADPFAEGRPLYYYHSKTPFYNELFFRWWDDVIPKVFKLVAPWMIVNSQEELEQLKSLEFEG
jgi:hypothetical protein